MRNIFIIIVLIVVTFWFGLGLLLWSIFNLDFTDFRKFCKAVVTRDAWQPIWQDHLE